MGINALIGVRGRRTKRKKDEDVIYFVIVFVGSRASLNKPYNAYLANVAYE